MGCDIHFYVEKKIKGKWVSADEWEKDEDGYEDVKYQSRFYSGRNYALFSILAGVRNYSDLPAISQPRGVPEDASRKYKKKVKSYGSDGHSHSYFTLAELLNYNWAATYKCEGTVSAKDYFKWKRIDSTKYGNGDEPKESYGGRDSKLLTEVEMDIAIKDVEIKNHDLSIWGMLEAVEKELPQSFLKLKWEVPYYKLCDNLFSKTIPRMASLGKADEVRACFFFDN